MDMPPSKRMSSTPNLDKLDNLPVGSMTEDRLQTRTMAFGFSDVCLLLKNIEIEMRKMNRTLALLAYDNEEVENG